jgi:DUF4097 and DUF4098 domain-containing protein YvlB
MINRRRLLLPALLAALAAAPAPAAAGQTLDVAREVSRVARTVTRYQGNRNQNRARQERVERQQVRVAQGALLSLHNIAGDITITAGGGDTATIEITKVAHAPNDAEARELLDLVKVEVHEAAGRAEVRAVYPEQRDRNRRRNYNVSTAYRVVAPAGARIKTDSISGSISVSGIRGELTLGTISGNVTIRDAGQRVTGQTISGNVDLVSAQDDAVVELSSTSGNVTANKIQVRRLDMGSISGSVIGRDLRCEQAELHTMSGNVEYTGSLVAKGRYEFRTHSGDVRLTLADGTGFELEASTFSGEVRSGLQLRMEGTVSRRNRTVRGTYGDGAARVEASSFSGNVLINSR